MSERRRWTPAENSKLDGNNGYIIKENYLFLTEALNERKTKQMVDQNWTEIADSINALGEGRAKLTTIRCKRNGLILKAKSKTAVMKYKKALSATGEGSNTVKEPSELQYYVASIMGAIATEGIAGAEGCDTSETASASTSHKGTATPFLERELVEELTGCNDYVPASKKLKLFLRSSTIQSHWAAFADRKRASEWNKRSKNWT